MELVVVFRTKYFQLISHTRITSQLNIIKHGFIKTEELRCLFYNELSTKFETKYFFKLLEIINISVTSPYFNATLCLKMYKVKNIMRILDHKNS
jgi:hypothetical protein